MNVPLLLITISLFTIQNVQWKFFCNNYYTRYLDGISYNTAICAFTALLFWVLAFVIEPFTVSMYSVVYGILFGITYPLCLLITVKALSLGSMAYTNLLTLASLIIPTIFGSLFFKEPYSIIQICGTILLIFSFFLGICKSTKTNKQEINIKWLGFALLASLTNGTLGILQKLHTSAMKKKESLVFFCIAFTASVIFMLVVTLYTSKRKRCKPYSELFSKNARTKLILLAIAIALCSGAGNWLTMFMAGEIPSNILFPVINGGILTLSATLSVLIFKEKLTVRQVIGLVIGTIAILLISNVIS